MKWALAVALLLMSFASVAFADGPDPIPPAVKVSKTVKAVVILADGPDPIPPAASVTKTVKADVLLSADGSDFPPLCPNGGDKCQLADDGILLADGPDPIPPVVKTAVAMGNIAV